MVSRDFIDADGDSRTGVMSSLLQLYDLCILFYLPLIFCFDVYRGVHGMHICVEGFVSAHWYQAFRSPVDKSPM